ncbi:MAG: serine--tRNA ligase [Patescibacteria group bacterium]|jgi:seryl-tRNA synthetase|nr:serine--tRNA ligase [Patescibacteria group bacterium]
MLDLNIIRENPEKIALNCKNRLSSVDIYAFLNLDKEIKTLKTLIEEKRAKRNSYSKVKPDPETIASLKKLGEEIKEEEKVLDEKKEVFKEIHNSIPNLTHSDVHVSDNEDDNPVLEEVGEKPNFDFAPLDHVELAAKHDLIDFDSAAKVSGSKFYYLKNELTLLEFALIQYAFNTIIKKGYTPFTTPDLAKREVLEGLGFNPRGDSTQVYNISDSDLCLIGTAEITLGGLHMNEVLDGDKLPLKYCAVSHCFRTEAGSYSKYSKGIFRVHQFSKIEMFQYVKPGDSEKYHEELLNIEKEIFSGLNIPYRVVDHCTADLGAPSIRTYDLEAWLPGKPNPEGGNGDWAEITSTSNCTDYQARGLNIKYKDENGQKNFVYTLNGTAIAITRCIIAILEINQQKDGSIKIPEILHQYMPENMRVIGETK